MKTLLAIFAHPDDESTINGGTLAKYAKNGWHVDLLVATKGDAGGWGDVVPADGQKLTDVRTLELQKASEILGIRSVKYLDYADGTLSDRLPGDIENSIARVIKEIRPDFVITHEPGGGATHHPDHAKMSLAATFAFQLYAKDRNIENPDDLNPPKLYYSCLPDSVVSYVVKQKYFPQESFDRLVAGVEDKRISTVIDIKRFSGVKEKALLAHETQLPILDKYMNIPHNPFLSLEYFILRYIGIQECFMGKMDKVADRL